MNLGVLCSGNLGLEVLKELIGAYSVVFVGTDKGSSSIISFAEENDLQLYIGNPREGRLLSNFKKLDIDVLISVNYLYLIERDLITLPKILAFNIHGSLLPKYRGRTPHVWSIINGEKVCGITAHVIEEGCDEGDVLEQETISIDEKDTGAIILEKYKQKYYPIIENVLHNISSQTITRTKQDETKATFFGKRTPEDGQIDWNWNKERIYNWVRAQSDPYPGAFSFYQEQKVIIDWVEYTDVGFHQSDPNGKIILVEDGIPFVKTPNGVVKLTKIRPLNSVKLQKDKTLR